MNTRMPFVYCTSCGRERPVNGVCNFCHPPHTSELLMAGPSPDDVDSMVFAQRQGQPDNPSAPKPIHFDFATSVYTGEGLRCMGIAKEALNLFAKKNADYGDNEDDLGPASHYIDIHRKVKKLKHSLWYGHDTAFEDSEEMLMDLIGNCLRAIDSIRQNKQ